MSASPLTERIRQHIRTVPDWPTPGVQFRDITPLLHEAEVFRAAIASLVERYRKPALQADVVAGLDARGFIVGAVLAYELGLGFVPVRKKGKLPFQTITETYALEYGYATVELHTDAVRPGQRVLLVDDLIATGGTLLAAKSLIEQVGGVLVEACAIVDLPDLGGSAKLQAAGLATHCLVAYPGH